MKWSLLQVLRQVSNGYHQFVEGLSWLEDDTNMLRRHPYRKLFLLEWWSNSYSSFCGGNILGKTMGLLMRPTPEKVDVVIVVNSMVVSRIVLEKARTSKATLGRDEYGTHRLVVAHDDRQEGERVWGWLMGRGTRGKVLE